MNLKSKLRISRPLTTIISVAVIVMFGAIFHSCEKEDFFIERPDYLEIEGDISDSLTLFQPENLLIYRKARDRFHKSVQIEGQKLVWSSTNGIELNMSEDIFNYFVEKYKEINERIDNEELIAYFDSKNQIRITLFDKTENGSLMRLKSGTEGGGEEKNPVTANYSNDYSNQQDNLEDLINFYNEEQSGNLNDYINLNGIEWDGNMMGASYVKGEGRINGHYTTYYIDNACYYSSGGYDCVSNDICNYERNDYSDRYTYQIKNCYGRTIVTIQMMKN
jgi:hypothetical protein